MKKIFIIILTCVALFATSCERELEIPQKGVVMYDNYYANDDDAMAALTDMYANYISQVAGTEGNDNPAQAMINLSADDILAGGSTAGEFQVLREFCQFTYDYANLTLMRAYQRYYFAIYHANLVISNFTNENRDQTEPKFTSEFTKQAVAEARVMRAYLHLMTALTWNCPPLVDRLLEADELPTNAESQQQILEWVISECETAIASGKLPVRQGIGDAKATARMSVGFAQFIVGKAAMFNNDPATARKYLADLINSGNYELTPSEDYWTNFHVSGDGNSEKIFEPNFIEDAQYKDRNRGRWNVSAYYCWRTDHLASSPTVHYGISGWNGGVIQEDFAEKFLEHDGNSPRRLACFLTADEWMYEIDWTSDKNDASLAEKKTDRSRGISSAEGLFSRGPYFEWKNMSFTNPPKILTGGKTYPPDNLSYYSDPSNATNFKVARYAEALLLYAEACIGSSDEAKGLAALNAIQERSGSGKISSQLTFEDVMEEKQYEMWFESCRFFDLVRWSQQGKVDLNEIFNESGIHDRVPVLKDAMFTKGEPEHRLYTEYTSLPHNFVEGRNEYFPFPRDYMNVNPNLKNVLGWSFITE